MKSLPRGDVMAQRARHGKKQKNSRLPGAVIWMIMIAIFGGAALFLVSNFHQDTKNNVQKVAYPQKYSKYVDEASLRYNLNPALIYAVIHTESGFNPDAQSYVGACGLMQVMPDSFEWLMDIRGESGKYTEEDLYTPEINIDYGCYLLRYNLDYFDQDEICAVAAYNAGFGKVAGWLADASYSSDGKTLDNPDDIPIDETRDYVKKVEDAKNMYTELYYSKNN